MSDKKKNTTLLLTIFITVFIDLLGVSIIIPVIPSVLDISNPAIGSQYSEASLDILYGLLLMCYPLMQFFGAPILGAISDNKGRKPILTVALLGTMIGYIFFAYAVYTVNIPLMFVSRMLPGFTGGNISIIMSSIADVSTKEARTRNFGLVGMAFGIGFVIGPVVGGILSDSAIVSWFSHYVPFVFTALLTFINIVLVHFFFNETLKKKKDTKISMFAGIINIKKAFQSPNLRNVFIVVLLLSVGFTFYTNYIAKYLMKDFGFSEKDLGYLFGYIGLWLAFTQGFVVRKLSKTVLPKRILMISMPVIGFGIFMMIFPKEAWMFYIINPIIALGKGTTAPNMSTIVSSQVSEEQQGAILGINQSMQSLGQIIPTAVGGFLLTITNYFPIVVGACVIFLAYIIYLYNFNRIKY